MKKPQTASLAYLLLTLTALFWSGNVVIARAMQGAIPPMTLSFGRWVLACSVLAPFALRLSWRDRHLLWAQRSRVLALAVFGIAGYNSLLYTGVQYTTATNAALLNSFIPILTALFGALWFKQSMSVRQGIGMGLSFAGVLVIISHGEMARLLALDLNRGDVIVFNAMISWALYTLLLRGLDTRIDRLGLLGALTAVGSVLLLPFFLNEFLAGQTPVAGLATWATFAYVGTFPSVLAYLFYNYGVGQIGPAKAAAFVHLMPLFVAGLATLFLNEFLHFYHFFGMIAIFSGLYLSTYTKS